jgi:hypothetical protein
MSNEQSHEELLREVLEVAVRNNQQLRPGTPLAELKTAIESALRNLPPLEFEEFAQAVEDADAAQKLVQRAPEIVGWNADQIVAWIEELAKKL